MIYVFLIILILLSAFFSSLETGLLALGEVRIRKWASTRIELLDIWIRDPAGIITGILVGNNLVNITFSALFTVIIVRYAAVTMVPPLFTEVISIFCSSAIILTAGEIIPKIYANTYPENVVRSCYGPFMIFFNISKAIIDMLNKIAFSMVGVMKYKKERSVSRNELDMALKDIGDNGVLEEESSVMLGRVLSLTRKTVGEVMVSRKMIKAVDINWEYKKIIDYVNLNQFSRIPVFRENIDNIVGILYIKDLIGELNNSGTADLKRIIRHPFFTYPGRNCQHLFQELRKKRTHCAIVMSNERVAGFVTIEDLIEEVVGEIYDEYDYKPVTA
jgi:CBS domain containing-hemolysin-like protein